MALVPSFTRKANADWAKADLSPDCIVISYGLACFAGVTDADCQHEAIIVGDANSKICRNSTESTPYWVISKPVLVAHTMHSTLYDASYLAAFLLTAQPDFHLETLLSGFS